MRTRIALAGNPNCGKTTMFNALTGSTQFVGNWPGVTVEKKEGTLKGFPDVTIIDLPGIYSLSPYTLEEVVTRDYLLQERPNVILNIVDGSNLERNLYLTVQLLEVGIPVIIALNMIDIVKKRGDKIDIARLAAALGCAVVETSALKGEGSLDAARQAVELAQAKQQTDFHLPLEKEIAKAISSIEVQIKSQVEAQQIRYFATKLFERDEKITAALSLQEIEKEKIEQIISTCEKALDDDAESIITNERYDFVTQVMKNCVHKSNALKETPSDKIDKIITNRFLALPIFALIMWLVYYISVTSVGTIVTDWTNDVFVGEFLQANATAILEEIGTAQWLIGLIIDGFIGGVGAVIGFLPQMMVLFFFLAILEDCGYMARIAFIMDRVFRKFGMSGKSFIPMLIGTGCGVPGIMASRTIENEKDRRMTIMTTTFIPCSAKLPVIALFAGALFPQSSWVGPSAYFIGMAAIVFSGVFLKKTEMFSGDPAPFVLELPPYHIPSLKGVWIQVWDKAKAFAKKAGSVIFLACGAIWFLQSFNWSLEMVETGESMLASIGSALAPLFAPLGWGDWRATVATVTGLVAKENVVGTFGVLYGAAGSEMGTEMMVSLQTSFTQVSAYSFLAFNLLCAPCFAAIGAIRKEMGNWKWTIAAVAYQTGLAYLVSLLIYSIGSIVLYKESPILSLSTLLVFVVGAGLILGIGSRNRKRSEKPVLNQ